jgi:hypothetical protein
MGEVSANLGPMIGRPRLAEAAPTLDPGRAREPAPARARAPLYAVIGLLVAGGGIGAVMALHGNTARKVAPAPARSVDEPVARPAEPRPAVAPPTPVVPAEPAPVTPPDVVAPPPDESQAHASEEGGHHRRSPSTQAKPAPVDPRVAAPAVPPPPIVPPPVEANPATKAPEAPPVRPDDEIKRSVDFGAPDDDDKPKDPG